jgi:hypothetical protein
VGAIFLKEEKTMFKDSSTKQGVIWGGLLIVFGVLGLLDSILDISLWVWVGALGILGIAVFAVYLSDTSEWWPLIPAYILVSLAVFLAAVELEILSGSYLGAIILGLIAVPFLLVYFLDRSQWWPLIPSYVLLLIAGMLVLIELGLLEDAWTATFVLGGIGLPFLYVYFRNRENWWALIPAYVMLDIGIMVGLIDARVLRDTIIPAYVFLSIALPFFVVYLNDTSKWWSLIPGGVMGLMGVIFLMTGNLFQYVVPILIILAGALILGRQLMTRSPEGKTDEVPPEE